MSLFQNSVLNKYLNELDNEKVEIAWEKFKSHFHNPDIQENIRNSKEEQYQGEFLIDLFVNVFSYVKNPTPNFNLTTELKNVKGAKKADGAILRNDEAIAVIELKGTDTIDLAKVETQAFGYKNNHPKCVYIITSNFEKLRFYIENAVEFEEFNLFNLDRKRFDLLYLCLSADRLLDNIPKKIKDESISEGEIITKKLYRDYSNFRNEVFSDIVENNPHYDKLTLFRKTQKLLDRFLFILFAEDKSLLPPNSTEIIIKDWKDLRDKYDEYFPLYERFKKYFGYLNEGYKGKKHDIFAYNGGLFLPDDILDNIKIGDELLSKHTKILSNYDFASEVSVNILGHIFEHSLTEIESIQAELKGEEIDKSKTKRKKDGVFYTPTYITKYIVDNTIGKLCGSQKAALEINEEDYEKRKGRRQTTVEALRKKLDDYREWLLNLTICDPACGSGAFLNQALEFLIAEHRYVDELYTNLEGFSLPLTDLENAILENNLFGVDINEESVEIAKLSLWLRTAQKGRKLTTLNHNIKCGNSLIDDAEIAGEKAFVWKDEFPKVFANGGFDVVIGNPPWGAKLEKVVENHLLKIYPIVPSKLKDSYMYFMLLCLKILKNDSFYGLIVPNTWLLINSTADFRKEILSHNVKEITDYGDGVFQDAIVESSSIFLKKEITPNGNVISKKYQKAKEIINHTIEKKYWLDDELNRIVLELKEFDYKLIKKMESCSSPFDESSEIIFGIKPYQKGYGKPPQTRDVIDDRIFHSETRNDETWKPLVTGTDVNKYSCVFNKDAYIKYGEWLMYSSNEEKILNKKILLRRTSSDLRAAIDNNSYYPQNSLFVITSNYQLEYIVALINSKLFDKIYKAKCPQVGKVFAEVKPSIIKSLPIAKANKISQESFKEKTEQLHSANEQLHLTKIKLLSYLQSQFPIEKFTQKLQNWHELEFAGFINELGKAIKKTGAEKLTKSDEMEWMELFETKKVLAQAIKSEIDATDRKLDEMVYKLYGLDEDEIAIVEKSLISD